jgi:hypothetical protein
MIRLLILVVIITIYVLIVGIYRKYLTIKTMIEYEQNKKYINMGLLFGSNNSKMDNLNNKNNEILDEIERTKEYNIPDKINELEEGAKNNRNKINQFVTSFKENIFNNDGVILSNNNNSKILIDDDRIDIHTPNRDNIIINRNEQQYRVLRLGSGYEFVTGSN